MQTIAQAQSRPELCQIHEGNINCYVCEYNIFTQSAPTLYRPLTRNNQFYEIAKNFFIKPLFYTGNLNGDIIAVFQFQNIIGKLPIGDQDVVTYLLSLNTFAISAQIVGSCINGAFIANQNPEMLDIYKFPLEIQSALQEAKSGIMLEQLGNAMRGS